MTPRTPLVAVPKHIVDEAVARGLAEDLGLSGDITTNATVPLGQKISATLTARQAGVVSGLDVAEAVFHACDTDLSFSRQVNDGEEVEAQQPLATIEGSARAILTGERVALNFVGRMSGIATLTRKYVATVTGTNAVIVDTRKTTPGLRAFEKYAVRCGGGGNHRSGLFDAVMIKDNHIVAAGDLSTAITRARDAVGHTVKIEVELDTLDQLDEALAHDIDCVLLDNMNAATLREAVRRIGGRVTSEASGGVSLATVGEIANTGVDLISVGALTHSAVNFDVGLDFAG